MTRCAVPTCERRTNARGLCKPHYSRLLRRLESGMPCVDLAVLLEHRGRAASDTCAVDGCGRDRQKGKTRCSMHISRAKRWGALEDVDREIGTPILRFVRRIDPQPDGCWLWTGAVHHCGYGAFTVDGRHVRAHRFAYEHYVGPIAAGLVLDHLCSVKRCVNPDHLEAVEPAENTRRWKERTGPGPNRKERAA